MFGVTAGYHRYFSHRSYKLGRAAQFLMAFLAQTSGQKGVLWWAAHHREHHRHSDQEHDVHSPGAARTSGGRMWAGCFPTNTTTTNRARVADFGTFPELRWLDRYHWFPTVALPSSGPCISFAARAPAFRLGLCGLHRALYHCTFAINSFAHVFGTRRFDTADQSRNNWLLALLTFGEGWHNNHHFSMASCRQGDRWWEIDFTYYGL